MKVVKSQNRKLFLDDPVALFLEAGFKDQSNADSLVSYLATLDSGAEDGLNYQSHTFVKKCCSPPTQAADMFAWHASKYIKDKRSVPRRDFRALIRPEDVCLDLTETLCQISALLWTRIF